MILSQGINQFRFGDCRSWDDMRIIITDSPDFVVPERDVELTTIPGRDGEIYIDNGRYKNTTISYKIAVLAPNKELSYYLSRISTWLSDNVGYKRLTDTYTPKYYRMAAVSGAISIAQKLGTIGTGTVKFTCKPYRYRVDGDAVITLTDAGRIYNPEAFEALPKISIFGEGNISLYIGGTAYDFDAVEGRIEVDSELLVAYRGELPQNDKLAFDRFPTLESGYNDIAFEGNVSSVQITPRWRTL